LEISILTHNDKKKHISKLNIDSLLMDNNFDIIDKSAVRQIILFQINASFAMKC
tara:strand:+ start:476 stop:637 length:162 start_codon:yes stop_codon:yes gene_type:complete